MAECGVLDLRASDLTLVRGILEEYVPGRPVFVFGSRATGRARRRSDLDLAIAGEPPLTSRMRNDLAEAFDQSNLPIEVDIVDLTSLTPVFRERITSEWIPLPEIIQPDTRHQSAAA